MTDPPPKQEEARTPARVDLGGAMYLYRQLWKYSYGIRWKLVTALVLLAGAQALILGVPFLAGKAINTLQLHGIAGLGTALLWLLCVLVVSAFFWLLHGPGRLLERNVSLIVRQRIAFELLEHLLKLPLAWHEQNHSGASAHRVTQSSAALAAFAGSQFQYLGISMKVIGSVVALCLINGYVGLVAAIGFCAITGAVIGFERTMIRLTYEINGAERRFSASLIDGLANSVTVTALRQARGLVKMMMKRMDAIIIPFKRSIVVNELKWCTVDLATRALSCLLVMLFVWLAARSAAAEGRETLLLGSLYMVWEYAQQANNVIVSAANNLQGLARQHVDCHSADPIRQASAQFDDGEASRQTERWARCDVRGVLFRHSSSRMLLPAVDHVSLSLQRGRRYALIGSSGSGKSTLMRVLAGLYVADKIAVFPAGAPMIDTPTEAAGFLRRCATLIPQDAELFEGSLAENLSMCEAVDGAPAPRDLAGALRLAAVDQFITLTPEALDAPVSERGANWSGGQRARVALARGVLAARGSSLVMLDEPTASLDPKTEATVYGNLFGLFSDACLIASVHRMNLLPHFDEIIVMSNGRVVAQGPAELLALTSQEYRELHSAELRRQAMQESV